MSLRQGNERIKRLNSVYVSLILALILAIASWVYIIVVDQASLRELFSAKNIFYAKRFLGGLLGINETKPAFLDMGSWKKALGLTLETLMMSIIAIGFATLGMLLTVVPAARTTDTSESNLEKGYRKVVFGGIRLLYVFSRSVPELIWAMMIIYILKPGMLPGAIALSIHNFGILGKLCAEVLEDLDSRPLQSLAASGAGKAQLLIYGVIPMVFPKFLTYILYRWEVIIRTTVVVGFVGAGGLGQQFKLSMSWFHYTEITLLLICYFILVVFTDLISEGLRRVVQ